MNFFFIRLFKVDLRREQKKDRYKEINTNGIDTREFYQIIDAKY